LSNQRFGRLTARWPAGVRCAQIVWLCSCDCGRLKLIEGQSLRYGHSKSCGCLSAELTRVRNRIHGQTATPEHKSFSSARGRCTNSNDAAWKNYGGRGIEFRFTSFNQFFAELGPKPTPRHTLDRINNDGHYEPGNVRWATRKQQALNQRKRRRRI
jgi:hypothetical protein